MIQFYFPLAELMKERGLSERTLSEKVHSSRGAIRSILQGGNLTLDTLSKVSNYFNLDLTLTASPVESLGENSVLAASLYIERDGFESWKIHIFNFVDGFKRSLDPKLILLPPVRSLDPKLYALLCSIVKDLTQKFRLPTPSWAKRRYFLKDPWFVSEMENLKASALIESPIPYRENNIFVHENFLDRA